MRRRAGAETPPMSFFRVWLGGYSRPAWFVEQIHSKPAPHWGVYAQLLRAALDSFLVYLPLALSGRVPPTASYLSFIPTERYYAALVWLTPLVLMGVLLLQASVLHLALRLLGRVSDFDRIVNLVGMAALLVGAVLIPWDWLWLALGSVDQIFLGVSHLAISLWAIYLIALGLSKMLSVPRGLALALALLSIPVGLPLAIMFMRSPL